MLEIVLFDISYFIKYLATVLQNRMFVVFLSRRFIFQCFTKISYVQLRRTRIFYQQIKQNHFKTCSRKKHRHRHSVPLLSHCMLYIQFKFILSKGFGLGSGPTRRALPPIWTSDKPFYIPFLGLWTFPKLFHEP
jgi:hypothetical protein